MSRNEFQDEGDGLEWAALVVVLIEVVDLLHAAVLGVEGLDVGEWDDAVGL